MVMRNFGFFRLVRCFYIIKIRGKPAVSPGRAQRAELPTMPRYYSSWSVLGGITLHRTVEHSASAPRAAPLRRRSGARPYHIEAAAPNEGPPLPATLRRGTARPCSDLALLRKGSPLNRRSGSRHAAIRRKPHGIAPHRHPRYGG